MKDYTVTLQYAGETVDVWVEAANGDAAQEEAQRLMLAIHGLANGAVVGLAQRNPNVW